MAKKKRKVVKRRRARKYTGAIQHFHNFEHDLKGRTHCQSDGLYPYRIHHHNGRHVISSPVARGHGRGGKPQFFRFKRRLAGGYDMASGVRVAAPRKRTE